MCMHPAAIFPIVIVGPFTKWGIDFTTCNPPSTANHKHIIVAVDYFTKWAKAMPTYKNDSETTTLFLFNQIISGFGIPREIATNHGSHFQNQLMSELALKLGFWQEHSSPYYPQANGQVEAVNKSLKAILQRTIDKNHSNWHLMLYPALWAYRTSRTLISKSASFIWNISMSSIEMPPQSMFKTQYDSAVRHGVFSEGDFVLVYDQDKNALGVGKFMSMWYGPFINKQLLEKGAYELVDFEGNKLAEPRNGLYLKKYFA
eukprot:PITA_19087